MNYFKREFTDFDIWSEILLNMDRSIKKIIKTHILTLHLYIYQNLLSLNLAKENQPKPGKKPLPLLFKSSSFEPLACLILNFQ